MPLTVDLLLRHTSDAVLLLDDAHRVVRANGRAESLLRIASRTLVGLALGECVPDFGGSRAEAQLPEVTKGSVERRLDHFSPSRYTWFEIRAVPVDGSGLVLFLRDVTDRVRGTRTEAVREAVREIIMDAPVAISITRGPEHRYEVVNTLGRRLIGGRDVEGMTMRKAFPEVDAALFAVIDEVYRTGRPYSARDLEVTFDRTGAGEFVSATFDVVYQPLFEADGSVSGILNLSVETTDFARERRALEGRSGGVAS